MSRPMHNNFPDTDTEIAHLRQALEEAQILAESHEIDADRYKNELRVLKEANYELQSLDYWQTKVEVKERDARIKQLEIENAELRKIARAWMDYAKEQESSGTSGRSDNEDHGSDR